MPSKSLRFLPAALALLCAITHAVAQADAPEQLPSPEQLFERVRANQEQVERVVRNYIYIKSVEEQQFDKQGKAKKTERREYECYRIGRTEIERLLSQDGVALTAREQEKEAKRVRKQEEKARKRAEREEEPEFTLSEVLRAVRFFNPRRERHGGQLVVAYDFEPNPQFRPKNKRQEVLHKLAGAVWVDEQAAQVVRMDARLIEGVKVGWGLVGSVREGARLVFEQQRINDEVWLPSLVQADLGVRIVFRNRNVRMVGRYSSYRKFRTDHTITGVAAIPETD